jgi:predicted DNA-binding protein with PD1-like motif
MKATLLADTSQEKTYALIFDKDDEVIGELTAFARTRRISAAHFTAIGAFREVTLAYFDPVGKRYRNIPVREQVEVLSLVGDIALDRGEPKVHAHAVVGKADATAHGGHLVEARVWPTLELVLSESPRHLRRRTDAETGLALIDLTVPEPPSV